MYPQKGRGVSPLQIFSQSAHSNVSFCQLQGFHQGAKVQKFKMKSYNFLLKWVLQFDFKDYFLLLIPSLTPEWCIQHSDKKINQ